MYPQSVEPFPTEGGNQRGVNVDDASAVVGCIAKDTQKSGQCDQLRRVSIECTVECVMIRLGISVRFPRDADGLQAMAFGTLQAIRIGLTANDDNDRGREFSGLDVIDEVLQRRAASREENGQTQRRSIHGTGLSTAASS